MSNIGKFYERSPNIVPAGISSGDPTNSLRSCLQYISLEDKVEALKDAAGIKDEKAMFPAEPENPDKYNRMYTQVRELIQPEPKSTFQEIENEIQETCYQSHWNAPLGKTRDQIPNLPAGLDPFTTTFGTKTERNITAGELVNPQKLPGQVIFESNIGRELYRKTHNDYDPSEQVDRNYRRPNYDPRRTWGIPTPSYPEGKWVRRNLHWVNPDEVCAVSWRQADHAELTRFPVGHPRKPFHILGTCVREDFAFGRPTERPMYGPEELIKIIDPCFEKWDQIEYLGYANALRYALKKRLPAFPFDDFLLTFRHYDNKQNGFITLEILYKLCNQFRVSVERRLLEALMKTTGTLTPDNLVDYEKFVKLIDIRCDFPQLGKIPDVLPQNLHYETSYAASGKDKEKIDNSKMPPSGVPSVRHDFTYPKAATRIDTSCLGDQTNVRTLIAPSIFTQYGLSHRDFFQPRAKEFIQKIFCQIGVTLPDDLFEYLWQEGLSQDQTGGVCVETFRNLLDRLAAHHFATQ